MNLDQVKETMVDIQKGANIIIEWTRPAKTRKGVTAIIQKKVRMVGRIGIEYDNQKVVQEKRENGELPAENQGLPWGRFEIYPYLIEHKDVRYLRLYKGTSAMIHPKVTWIIDGNETNIDAISSMLLKSELDKSEGDCFCVKTEDITRLHTETVIEGTEMEKTEKKEPIPVIS